MPEFSDLMLPGWTVLAGQAEELGVEIFPGMSCSELVYDKDAVAGDPHKLAAMLPKGAALDIPGRDHNLAVGDKVYKQGVLEFLAVRP